MSAFQTKLRKFYFVVASALAAGSEVSPKASAKEHMTVDRDSRYEIRVVDPDTHCFQKLDPDPDPHQIEKLDTDPDQDTH